MLGTISGKNESVCMFKYLEDPSFFLYEAAILGISQKS